MEIIYEIFKSIMSMFPLNYIQHQKNIGTSKVDLKDSYGNIIHINNNINLTTDKKKSPDSTREVDE